MPVTDPTRRYRWDDMPKERVNALEKGSSKAPKKD